MLQSPSLNSSYNIRLQDLARRGLDFHNRGVPHLRRLSRPSRTTACCTKSTKWMSKWTMIATKSSPCPELTLTEVVIALTFAIACVALMAIFLVIEIPFMVEERGISDAFMGLILVPLVEKTRRASPRH